MSGEIIIKKPEYERIINAGFKNGELNFVSNLVNLWLNQYPNDIKSEFYLTKFLLLQNDKNEAVKRITKILLRDLEFFEAYELLKELKGDIDKKAVTSFMFVLSGTTENISKIYPWAVTLRSVRMGIRKNDLNNSEKLINNLLENEPNNPLVALAHCQLLIKKKASDISIFKKYHHHWPECIQFALFYAKEKFDLHEEADAVRLLHMCAVNDPGGQVAHRILNTNDELLSYWDSQQSIKLNIQIPSSIAVSLNWNQLPLGNKNSRKTNDFENKFSDKNENYLNAQVENLIDKKNEHRKSVLKPAYIILTTRSGLEKKYGKKTTEIILEQLRKLSTIIQEKKNWDSLVFLPDDQSISSSFGLEPLSSIDPWKIKNALSDLDKQLKTRSKMIGALLIIGGDEVVPFHKLPNPTDDSDDTVISDNPYCTTSSNYLAPEWATGRLPDERGSDPGLILEQIRQISNFHQSTNKQTNILFRILAALFDKTKLNRIIRDIFAPPKNFGYSAAVWRRSTLAAFRPIGAGASLRVTPPYVADTIDVENLMKSKCAYFNLHGLSNSPEWYGQRDFSEKPSGPDFPVALSSKQISKLRNNVDLTFSEACFGGFILNKSIEESIALKLISIGSQGLVASTCIAYGSVFPPLIGADLLAFIFWKYIKDGYTFGEALMQAKIGLIKVMIQRQGYLDGEDQKTLESFVLYGDPLGYLEENIYLEPHTPVRDEDGFELKIVSDQDGYPNNVNRISQKVAKELNEIVESYIPDLNNADIKIRQHQIRLNSIMKSEKNSNGTIRKNKTSEIRNRTQVTYSQKIKSARSIHEQFARLTLDETGKVIKLAVSR